MTGAIVTGRRDFDVSEIHIDLVPVLLGAGIRLFDHLGTEPIDLECAKVIETPGVTYLRYRIVK